MYKRQTNNNSTKLWGINCITDLVFIDSQIEDYQSLVNGVLPGVKVVFSIQQKMALSKLLGL